MRSKGQRFNSAHTSAAISVMCVAVAAVIPAKTANTCIPERGLAQWRGICLSQLAVVNNCEDGAVHALALSRVLIELAFTTVHEALWMRLIDEWEFLQPRCGACCQEEKYQACRHARHGARERRAPRRPLTRRRRSAKCSSTRPRNTTRETHVAITNTF